MAKGFMTRRSGNLPSPAYEGNMNQFFAIPGSSGKIRLKIEKPIDATGVMLRYKTTAWASGDTKDTGTLIASVTDDSFYKGINQWYEVTGLTDGTAYYFKAFPYKGDSYNETIGVNETVCKAGGLLCEITGDSIDGTTINDTSGNNNNGTSYGVTTRVGIIGSELTVALTNKYVALPTSLGLAVSSPQEIACWIKLTSLPSASKYMYLKKYGAHLRVGVHSTGELFMYNGGSLINTGIFITTNKEYLIIQKWNGSNLVTLKVKAADASVWSTATSSVTPVTESALFHLFGDATSDINIIGSSIDQFRFYNRETTADEDDNLWNGGAGC